jgi:hypothetical protein
MASETVVSMDSPCRRTRYVEQNYVAQTEVLRTDIDIIERSMVSVPV